MDNHDIKTLFMSEAAVAAKVLCDLLDSDEMLVKSVAKNYSEFSAIVASTSIARASISFKSVADTNDAAKVTNSFSCRSFQDSKATAPEGNQWVAPWLKPMAEEEFDVASRLNSEPCSRSVSNTSSEPLSSSAPPPAGESVVASASAESDGDKNWSPPWERPVESDSELVCESVAPGSMSPRSLPPTTANDDDDHDGAVPQPSVSTLCRTESSNDVKKTSDESGNSVQEGESMYNSAEEERTEDAGVVEDSHDAAELSSATSEKDEEQEHDLEQEQTDAEPHDGDNSSEEPNPTANGVTMAGNSVSNSESKEVDNKSSPTQDEINSQFVVLPWLRAAGEDNVPLRGQENDFVNMDEDDNMGEGEGSAAPTSPRTKKPEFARRATLTLEGGELTIDNDAFLAMMSNRI